MQEPLAAGQFCGRPLTSCRRCFRMALSFCISACIVWRSSTRAVTAGGGTDERRFSRVLGAIGGGPPPPRVRDTISPLSTASCARISLCDGRTADALQGGADRHADQIGIAHQCLLRGTNAGSAKPLALDLKLDSHPLRHIDRAARRLDNACYDTESSPSASS